MSFDMDRMWYIGDEVYEDKATEMQDYLNVAFGAKKERLSLGQQKGAFRLNGCTGLRDAYIFDARRRR